jgi:hypothetical protein
MCSALLRVRPLWSISRRDPDAYSQYGVAS